MQRYELKFASGEVVAWPGRDGEDAARRYTDAHPTATVVATRLPRFVFVPGVDPRQVVG